MRPHGQIQNVAWSSLMVFSSNDNFIPRVSTRLLGMGLHSAFLIKQNRLHFDSGQFYSYMHGWGLASLSNCDHGATEQTANQRSMSECPCIEHASE